VGSKVVVDQRAPHTMIIPPRIVASLRKSCRRPDVIELIPDTGGFKARRATVTEA
jgi:hypothetical protein